ncbi:MAG: hypothetical protein ABEJ40_07240 [Haloarculaceae archaeon]
MDLDRKTVVELAISAGVIVLFTAAAFVVSWMYAAPANATTNESVPPAVEPTGGLALVGTIGLFIGVVAIAGLWLYWADFDEEE